MPDADGAVVEVGEEPFLGLFGCGMEREKKEREVRREGEEVEEEKEPSRDEQSNWRESHLISLFSPESINTIPYHGSVGCKSTPLTRSVRWEKRFCW